MMPQQEDDSKTRTNWAEDRTILANERAFSSWMGMGLASVGIAIGFKAVFGAAEPTWPAKLVSFLFLGIAILIYWLARNQEYKTLMRLRERDAEAMPVRNFTQLTSLMSVATVAVAAVLWSL